MWSLESGHVMNEAFSKLYRSAIDVKDASQGYVPLKLVRSVTEPMKKLNKEIIAVSICTKEN